MTIIAGDREISDYTLTYAVIVMSVAFLCMILFFVVCVAIWLIPAFIVYGSYGRYPFVERHRAKIEKHMDRYYDFTVIFHVLFMFLLFFGQYSLFCEYLIRLALKL